MGELLVKERDIVVPGDVLAEGMDFLPGTGTYRQNERIRANRLGLLQIEGKILKTIPLSGRYLPKRNDIIIGRVIDILISGWRLDINCPYTAVLATKEATFEFIRKGADLSKILELEDYLVTKIINVTSQNLVDVNMRGPGLRKLSGGRIVKVNPYKVPRIIGKKGSMVSMIKKATDTKIIVGQNGIVWIQGDPEMEAVAVATIKKIEDESYLPGLTEIIKEFLEKQTGKKVEIPSDDELQQGDDSESEFSATEQGGFESRDSFRDRGGDRDRGFRRDSYPRRSFDRGSYGGERDRRGGGQFHRPHHSSGGRDRNDRNRGDRR